MSFVTQNFLCLDQYLEWRRQSNFAKNRMYEVSSILWLALAYPVLQWSLNKQAHAFVSSVQLLC